MRLARIAANFTKPSDATAYTAGDLIGNSLTGAAVLPMSFLCNAFSGRIAGARMTIQPASGNLVIVAADIDLLLFRPQQNTVPFAAAGYPADNAALTLTEAMYQDLIGVVSFVNGAWRNQLGALAAGTVGWQAAAMGAFSSLGACFNIDGHLPARTIYGLLQAKAAWTPGAVAQSISVALDVEPEYDP